MLLLARSRANACPVEIPPGLADGRSVSKGFGCGGGPPRSSTASTWTLEPGRRYVVIGPSGSGKSTMLRLLNRLEDPAEGRILLGDVPLEDLPVRAVRAGIGMVFQSPRPLPGTVAGEPGVPVPGARLGRRSPRTR